MAGRTFGSLGQWGRWNGDPFVTPQLNWNISSTGVSASRRLLHTGLAKVCDYPTLPTKTVNFSWDLLLRRDLAVQKTLASKRVTIWPAIIDDVIIREVWEAPGGLSFPWRFFNLLYEFYHASPDWLNGEALLWVPMDRTNKVYPVDLISITVNGEDFELSRKGIPYDAGPVSRIHPGSGRPGMNVFAAETLEIQFKLRPETAPSVSTFFSAGSATDETGNFEAE